MKTDTNEIPKLKIELEIRVRLIGQRLNRTASHVRRGRIRENGQARENVVK